MWIHRQRKSIYLIDCPGVVYPTGESDADTVLKGVVRVENVKEPVEFIPNVLEKVQPEHIAKTYKLDGRAKWDDHIEFLTLVANRFGKLTKGGEPDLDTVSKMVLNDFQRGKIPYFVKPKNDNSQAEMSEETPVQNNSQE